MALAYVRDSGKKQGVNVNTHAGSFGTLPAAGNMIVVLVSGWHNGSTFNVTAVTDNQGNTYTRVVDSTNVGGCKAEIWHCPSIGSPSGTFTITIDPADASANYLEWVAVEVSGQAISPADRNAENTGTEATTATSGTTAALSQADEIVFALASLSSSDTTLNIGTPAGYTEISEQENSQATIGHHAAYKIVASTAAVSAEWTYDQVEESIDWGAVIATFRAATGAASSRPAFQPPPRFFRRLT
jgi:hypothetical protein